MAECSLSPTSLTVELFLTQHNINTTLKQNLGAFVNTKEKNKIAESYSQLVVNSHDIVFLMQHETPVLHMRVMGEERKQD
jgi:hypothetical protein